MSLNAALLRSSFELIVERAPNLTHHFYDVFFARYPHVRPMFSRTMREKQEQMLTSALVAVLDHVEDAPWLTQTLHGLGARHVGYGVTTEMYGWVGECLLQALSDVAGSDWTPELAQEWTKAYGVISSLMLAGAAQVEARASVQAVRPSASAH